MNKQGAQNYRVFKPKDANPEETKGQSKRKRENKPTSRWVEKTGGGEEGDKDVNKLTELDFSNFKTHWDAAKEISNHLKAHDPSKIAAQLKDLFTTQLKKGLEKRVDILESGKSVPASSILEQCILRYEVFDELNTKNYPLPNDHDYCVYLLLNMIQAFGRLSRTFLNKDVVYLPVYYAIADIMIKPPQLIKDYMKAIKMHHQQWADRCLVPASNIQMEAVHTYIRNQTGELPTNEIAKAVDFKVKSQTQDTRALELAVHFMLKYELHEQIDFDALRDKVIASSASKLL